MALVVSVCVVLTGTVLIIAAAVRLDQSSGRFGRIAVPGESYGLPDVGTYVIADGDYAAGMHTSPKFTVTGPAGEEVPVEPVEGNRYGNEDNALAIFHVTTRGRHRLQVEVPPGAAGDVPRTVAVNRSMDGTGEPLTGAYVALVLGLGLGAIGGVLFVVSGVVLVLRRP